jgi:hypothetical protein
MERCGSDCPAMKGGTATAGDGTGSSGGGGRRRRVPPESCCCCCCWVGGGGSQPGMSFFFCEKNRPDSHLGRQPSPRPEKPTNNSRSCCFFHQGRRRWVLVAGGHLLFRVSVRARPSQHLVPTVAMLAARNPSPSFHAHDRPPPPAHDIAERLSHLRDLRREPLPRRVARIADLHTDEASPVRKHAAE